MSPVAGDDTRWVRFREHPESVLDGARFRQALEGRTRKVYFQSGDSPERLIYSHGRAIELTYSEPASLVVLNDFSCSKCLEVVALHLDSRRTGRIDEAALQAYQSSLPESELETRTWARAIALSPDGSVALLRVWAGAIAVTKAQAGRFAAPEAWFAVSTRNGAIRKRFDEPPAGDRWRSAARPQ